MSKEKCYLCGNGAEIKNDPKTRDAELVVCGECGKYIISCLFQKTHPLTMQEKEAFKEYIKHENKKGKVPYITTDTLSEWNTLKDS